MHAAQRDAIRNLRTELRDDKCGQRATRPDNDRLTIDLRRITRRQIERLAVPFLDRDRAAGHQQEPRNVSGVDIALVVPIQRVAQQDNVKRGIARKREGAARELASASETSAAGRRAIAT